MKHVFIVLLLVLFISSVHPSTSEQNDNSQISFNAISKMITAAGWFWKAKDYIASCGRYTTFQQNNKVVVVWDWLFTKGTYVIDPKMGTSTYVEACAETIAPTTAFRNSKYNVLESLKGCEANMIVDNQYDAFVQCVSNVFGSKSMLESECQSKCFSGCPKWHCG